MNTRENSSGGTLRATVIGAGQISEQHLRFLADRKGVELSGVCDRSGAMARFAAGKFGAKRVFVDHRQMLEEVRPDVVHVITPARTHAAIVTDCLVAGAHVIVEKPIALSVRELHELWELSRSSGRHLVEDHNYRFNRPVVELEELVRSGRLGQIKDVEVRLALKVRAPGNRYSDANLPHPSHELPAGVVHEFITHMCYVAQRFAPPAEDMHVVWENEGHDSLFKYDHLDAIVVGGGCHTRLRFSSSTWPESFEITVRGTEGSAQAELFHPFVRPTVPRFAGAQLTPVVNHFAAGFGSLGAGWRNFWNKLLQRTPYEGLATFLRLTYDAFESGGEPPVTLEDMERAVGLIDRLVCEGSPA